MTLAESHAWLRFCRRLNPSITPQQAAALARRLTREKRAKERNAS